MVGERYLILRFDAPLVAFGGTVVDNRGVAASFPALSMVTGLLANALGYERGERERLQRLQDRLMLASRVEGVPELVCDFQTVQLGAGDRGWTTRGTVEGRKGNAATYRSPHIRERDFWAGITATLAVCLHPTDEVPTLDDLATALRRPARPLFLGRKPCLPSRPFLDPEPFVQAGSVRTALDALHPVRPLKKGGHIRHQWPALPGEVASAPGVRQEAVTDQRSWHSGPHGGSRLVFVDGWSQ